MMEKAESPALSSDSPPPLPLLLLAELLLAVHRGLIKTAVARTPLCCSSKASDLARVSPNKRRRSSGPPAALAPPLLAELVLLLLLLLFSACRIWIR